MSKIRFDGCCYGETNQGKVRTNNEDTYICQFIWDDRHIVCAAIDGLGGYEGGEIAAEISRSTIIKHLEEFRAKGITEILKDAVIEANNEIIRQRKAYPKSTQMGCVASIGLIDLENGVIAIAHVGDSRIYRYTDGELKKLTHDHSLVGYREEIGEMSEEDAMHHPQRNVIDKFLGEQYLSLDSTNYIEISVWPIIRDTQYLFCSDGLTDLVTSQQIIDILSLNSSIEDKVKMLIASANDAGGRDNITVVIANIRTNAIGNAHAEDFECSNKITEKKKSDLCPILSGICGFIIGIVISQMYNMYKADCMLEQSIHPNIELKLDNSEFGSHSTAIDDSTFIFTPELIKNDHRIVEDSLYHTKERVATQK